jgi:mannitol-specific phosphotransferase system IIBC component
LFVSDNAAIAVGVIFGIIIGAMVILITTYFVIRYYQRKHPESFFRDQFDYEHQRNEPSSAHYTNTSEAGNQNGVVSLLFISEQLTRVLYRDLARIFIMLMLGDGWAENA